MRAEKDGAVARGQRRMQAILLAGILVLGLGSVAGAAGARPLDQVARDVFSEGPEEWLKAVGGSSPHEACALGPASAGAGRKSARKAFFLSLLLPGLGQRYLGQDTRSWLYLGTEAGVWMAVGAFYFQGSMREDRYREYAHLVAGADPDRTDDEYYKNLALYESSDDFAWVVRWDARALNPDDREAQERYYRENVYPEALAWSWPSEDAFDEYKRLRRRSKRAYRTAVNTAGLAVLNRLVSAIDTVTGRERKQLAGGWEPRCAMRALPGDDGPAPFVYLHRGF